MFRCDVFPMSAIFVRSAPAYVHLFDCYIFVNPAPVDAGSSLKYIDSGDNIMKKCIIAGAGDFGGLVHVRPPFFRKSFAAFQPAPQQ